MKLRDSIRLLLLLCILMHSLICLAGDSADQTDHSLQIDPLAKRAAIRTELLKYTPVGSSSEEVLAFLKSRFLKKGDPTPELENHGATGACAEAAADRGVKVIRLSLGDYIPNPLLLTLSPPVTFQEAIIAQWAFDRNNKLIDLFLDRKLDE